MKKTVAGILLSVLCGAWLAPPGMAQPLAFQDSPFGFHPALPYDEAKNIGIQWTRGGDTPYLFWSLVDPNKTGTPAQFQWQGTTVGPTGQPASFDYDLLFLARDAGLNMMQNIAVQPPGQSGGHLRPGSWLSVDEAAYRNFVKEAVRRYPFIRYWQVGNEPNISFSSKLTGYADLQRITYEAIKEADPQAQVLMGGVAGNMSLLDMNDTYFESILPALGGKYVDVFDFHFYGDAKGGTLISDPQRRLLGYRDFKTVYAYFRNLLDRNGFSRVPIWVTEMGTFSGTVKSGPQTLTQTEADQARDLLKRWVYPLALGTKRIFWAFGLTEGFGQWNDDFFDHTGLIYGGQDGVHRPGGKKLGYYTHKKMTELLEGSDWNNIQTIQEAGDVYVYKFTRNGTPVYVAWWDYFNDPAYAPGKTVPVTLTGLPGNTVLATEAVPRFSTGAEVTSYATAFRQQTLTVNNGTVTLQLGESPVFVEGPAVSLRINGNPNVTVTTTSPVTVDYTLRDGAGQEFFLVLSAPAMNINLSYFTAAGQWIPLPANLSSMIPFTTAPADGDHVLYSGTAPAGAYSLCLGYDTILNGRLNLEAAVYDCVTATVH